MYNWHHSDRQAFIMYTSRISVCTAQWSPCFLLPFSLIPLLLPIRFPLLTWNPPCCDRIRPPRSQVVRTLNSSFPSPCSYTPHSRIPTPRGSPHPNIHSLGWHREPGSQDPAQSLLYPKKYLEIFSTGKNVFSYLSNISKYAKLTTVPIVCAFLVNKFTLWRKAISYTQ